MADLGIHDAPEVITLRGRGQGLRLRLREGEELEIDAKLLRDKCNCSSCLRASRAGHRPEPRSDISILELRAVGSMGLQAVFSDGHERGIYPWSYLKAIAFGTGVG